MPCKDRSYSLPFVLLLLAAGTGFGASPPPARLLPETAVLDRVDGRLLHVDANDTWLFELTMDVKTPDYQLPAGDALCAVALGHSRPPDRRRERPGRPAYRLSARVTRFRGKNYLYPTYYLPLSKFKGRPRCGEAGKPNPALRSPQSASGPPSSPIPPEILEQLKKQRPLRGPRRSTRQSPSRFKGPSECSPDCVGRIESSAGIGCRFSVVSPQRSVGH